jgi:hypothetical protein
MILIFEATPPESMMPPVAVPALAVEHAALPSTFSSATVATGIGEALVFQSEVGGDSTGIPTQTEDRLGDFDWSDPRLNRGFIRLEQRVLAEKATGEEERRYRAMLADRNSRIFADRSLRDYAEIQRLRKLSEKLAEVQRFLRPIDLR